VSDTWQQPTFEGMTVDEDEATVAAFNIVLDAPLHMYEEIEFTGKGIVTEVGYASFKDKSGFLESGRRKVKITPTAVALVRGDE
jgi:hypothetical protein